MDIPILIPGVNDFVDEIFTPQIQQLFCHIMLSKIADGTEPAVKDLYLRICKVLDGKDVASALYALAEAMNSTMAFSKNIGKFN